MWPDFKINVIQFFDFQVFDSQDSQRIDMLIWLFYLQAFSLFNIQKIYSIIIYVAITELDYI